LSSACRQGNEKQEAIPLYREEIAKALPRFEAELRPEAFRAAWERGEAMDSETAVAEMRAALSAVTA